MYHLLVDDELIIIVDVSKKLNVANLFIDGFWAINNVKNHILQFFLFL